jgi:hypothetical protein
MPKLVPACFCIIGLAFAVNGGQAKAQSTTTCMAMGPNMVTCNTLGPPSLPPEAPRPPVHCNNVQASEVPGDPYAGRSRLNRFLGTLGDALSASGGNCPQYLPTLQQRQIANFRMKVGKMLADGDCRGAARYALESGQLELGQSILAACHPDSAPAANVAQAAAPPLSAQTARVEVAAASPTPPPAPQPNAKRAQSNSSRAKSTCIRVVTDPSQSTC